MLIRRSTGEKQAGWTISIGVAGGSPHHAEACSKETDVDSTPPSAAAAMLGGEKDERRSPRWGVRPPYRRLIRSDKPFTKPIQKLLPSSSAVAPICTRAACTPCCRGR